MRNRLPYPIGLVLAAGKCDIDAARTPYAAAKEQRQLGIALTTRGGRRYISRTVNDESLPILKQARFWV